jgi:hypothetical protein
MGKSGTRCSEQHKQTQERRITEGQTPREMRALSRKDFLRRSGTGLVGAALVGAAACSGGLSGNKGVKFLTSTEETNT